MGDAGTIPIFARSIFLNSVFLLVSASCAKKGGIFIYVRILYANFPSAMD